jgi:ElaB/YqjD/DUF883 family membrane-anchored ribosome-binding protein
MQRWNGAGTSKPPAAAAAEPSTSIRTEDISSDVLDFGTSVNVNEDLRHSIKNEIIELDTSVGTHKIAIKSEERVFGQVKLDLSHAFAEMGNLSRGAADQLDKAGVHESIATRLEETFKVELVQSTAGSGAGAGASSDGTVLVEEKENAQEAAEKSLKNKNKEVIRIKTEFLKNIGVIYRQTIQFVDTAAVDLEALEDETIMIVDRIDSEKLEGIIDMGGKETEIRKKDVENELQRMRAMKAALQQTRTRCGTHAQHVADHVRLAIIATSHFLYHHVCVCAD